jgi:hypothetical protein
VYFVEKNFWQSESITNIAPPPAGLVHLGKAIHASLQKKPKSFGNWLRKWVLLANRRFRKKGE